MPVLAPDITSRWEPADQTDNRLEQAETEVPGLFALRSTYDRGKVVFVTAAQILALADKVTDSGTPIGQMVATGNGHNGHSRDQRRDSR
jgi:hypothetical protein